MVDFFPTSLRFLCITIIISYLQSPTLCVCVKDCTARTTVATRRGTKKTRSERIAVDRGRRATTEKRRRRKRTATRCVVRGVARTKCQTWSVGVFLQQQQTLFIMFSVSSPIQLNVMHNITSSILVPIGHWLLRLLFIFKLMWLDFTFSILFELAFLVYIYLFTISLPYSSCFSILHRRQYYCYHSFVVILLFSCCNLSSIFGTIISFGINKGVIISQQTAFLTFPPCRPCRSVWWMRRVGEARRTRKEDEGQIFFDIKF